MEKIIIPVYHRKDKNNWTSDEALVGYSSCWYIQNLLKDELEANHPKRSSSCRQWDDDLTTNSFSLTWYRIVQAKVISNNLLLMNKSFSSSNKFTIMFREGL